MAVYEFECADCGERFEVNTTISEHDRFKEEPPKCSKCGQIHTRQRIDRSRRRVDDPAALMVLRGATTSAGERT
jgi:putative FmdB family regulatory protein